MSTLKRAFKELFQYPSAVAGLVIIIILVGIAIYALVSIPYQEAVTLWRAGVGVWDENPRYAAPAWTNLFRANKLPESVVYDTREQTELKTVEETSGMNKYTILFPIDYPYDGFPQELVLYFSSTFVEKQPHVGMTWITPDGREINLGSFAIGESESWYASQDARLQRKLGMAPQEGLFANPELDTPVALEGTYQLRVDAFTFESDADVNVKMVLFGQVHGLAGTDHQRRDLMVALLWGTPIMLAFGLLAALGTSLTTMIIAAIGTWYGGWVDALIQRITGVNMVLPVLSVLIMVGTFYSTSIWLMLGVTILLNIFGAAILNYRAIFMQVRESPYIEAARAYGANDWRIIVRYLVPRIIPLLIPALVTLIPAYVFLEAALAVLGLGDPTLPTWGKIINDAQANGALFNGYYYWVLEPAVLLMLTGLAFSLVGFALNRIFNPRLRQI
jgi:peptide/nickel transport system permease protein